eukprot:Mycagemm_TRINITY_DN7357_c0_g1::TRINITY_DN7357_c0_g1_i1::g.4730::m.4730 type:complete len:171 gc:universal TRINITY_DN7357_c0_g1_i1:534-22(-)
MASKTAAKPKAKAAPKEKKERRLGVTVKDVSAENFIREYSLHLKRAGKLRLPKWVDYAKTGVAQELPPLDPNWLYVRAASIARKLYLRQGIGLGTFKKIYGRRERRGVMPIRFREGSGSIPRWILKELERLKIVEKDKNGGRKLTQSGQRDLDRIAGTVAIKNPPSAASF